MPVLLDFEQKAYDLNERILELLVSDTTTGMQALLLFIDPGTSSDGSATPWQGWHRVFPPLPVSNVVLTALRERSHHLYARRHPRQVDEVLSQVEALAQRAQALEDEQRARAFQALSARSRAGEALMKSP